MRLTICRRIGCTVFMKMKLCVLSVAGAMAFTGFSAFGAEKVSVAPGGGDDWQAITDAIANAAEQAVVELGAGEFVWLFVHDCGWISAA